MPDDEQPTEGTPAIPAGGAADDAGAPAPAVSADPGDDGSDGSGGAVGSGGAGRASSVGPDETVVGGSWPVDPSATAPAGPAVEGDGLTRVDGLTRGDAAPPAGAWRARAEVPRRPVGGPMDAGDPDGPAHPGAGGRWWMPILVGIIALLLFGVLGYGVWLIMSASSPDPVTPIVPSVRATSSGGPPASSAPARSTAPRSSKPAVVQVPALEGSTVAEARQALDARGLVYRLDYRTTADQSAGTVIGTTPAAGTRVPAGTKITLIVASAPRTTAPPTPPASADPAPAESTAPTFG